MKNQIVSVLILTLGLLSIGCEEENSTPSASNNPPPNPSNTLNVFSTFFSNGTQYGASATIDTSQFTTWYVDKNNGNQTELVSLDWRSPDDGQTYSGFFIVSPSGIPFHLGSNPGCEVTLGGGSFTYINDGPITVNFTKIASSVNDTYEGSFTGTFLFTDATNWPPAQEYRTASGSFKVPLKDF